MANSPSASPSREWVPLVRGVPSGPAVALSTSVSAVSDGARRPLRTAPPTPLASSFQLAPSPRPTPLPALAAMPGPCLAFCLVCFAGVRGAVLRPPAELAARPRLLPEREFAALRARVVVFAAMGAVYRHLPHLYQVQHK
ncbi:hypothetical protein GCM10009551_088650 [Nocardiopsis tropica]